MKTRKTIVPLTPSGGETKDRLKAFINERGLNYLFHLYQGTEITTLAYEDTENFTDFSRMFDHSQKLISAPRINTSNATNMSGMFYYCPYMTDIQKFDTSSVTNMSYMFAECSSLKTIPQLDTSNVANMASMFSGCRKLDSIPQLDTSSVTSMNRMFYDCSSLETIPQLDTSKVTDMSYMFCGCSSLISVPPLDASNVTNLNYIFANSCRQLKSILMYGMKVSFLISLSTQFEESDLVTILNNLATVTSTQTLTMGSTNLAKLTDEEKAIATNKGWTLK